MGNFFAEMVIGTMALIILCYLCLLILKIFECMSLILYKILKPCCCPDHYGESYTHNMLHNILRWCHTSTYFCDYCFFCWHRGYFIRLREYCKKKNKKNNISPKPVYDDAHIIVINPYEGYQIGTIAKVVN